MWHACKIRDNGFAADVLAQCQCQWRCCLVETLGLHDFAERHDFAVFIGNLQPHNRFARDDFNHADTDHRQRTGQVLGQVRNLADLDAGSGQYFEARNYRPRMDRLDLDLDAEICEFEFKLLRHGFER